VKYLLLGFVANGAGVIENQVSFLDRFHLAVTLMHQRANDLLRVMDIHLTAEGLDIKRLLRGLAHRTSISQQNMAA
jgi:predicted AAA+ superfamily ATPase